MTTTNVIETEASPLEALAHGDDAVRRIGRIVSVSTLATFLRDFPLTYLTKDERRVFLTFQKYAVRLESEAFEKEGIGL